MVHLPRTVELWYVALNDNQARMTAPEWHCEMLRRAATELLAAGGVDQAGYLDMLDLATGAQAHALEERAAQWFRPNRTYRVLLEGREVGQIARGSFSPSVPGLSDGLVRYDKRGELVMLYQRTIYAGDIRGRRWACTDGQTYTLTVIGCSWQGREWRAFSEPDEYRVALNMAELAEEVGHVEDSALWSERLEACEFQTCQNCQGRFALMDQCVLCKGTGVVGSQRYTLSSDVD
ncbi:TPA: hypothetical protein NI869_005089 [Pseudomonas aeruginosa]|uniref:hypothetical protein n=1 Tax=Pseudomonas aeruginosa TaxID=287 RepID=UPI000F53DA28|nr:hypothetical protein [Pseudomonas aeruginosa]RQD16448.1 hypothetical protein IPC339_18075 [Pseudomonas aeruginosa]HCE5541332.1 hypothetical protein [Pseudomonas aeruginosa]HCE5612537.1 hypothetical protein [Pseudomonas aeruginosa]HCE5709060.1 hypothetical protein [Pseudomonas aeruginosa]HCE5714044.1 hypothetical protein [Pseudomonas aeruginosa]